jgi:hypothetical protein
VGERERGREREGERGTEEMKIGYFPVPKCRACLVSGEIGGRERGREGGVLIVIDESAKSVCLVGPRCISVGSRESLFTSLVLLDNIHVEITSACVVRRAWSGRERRGENTKACWWSN